MGYFRRFVFCIVMMSSWVLCTSFLVVIMGRWSEFSCPILFLMPFMLI